MRPGLAQLHIAEDQVPPCVTPNGVAGYLLMGPMRSRISNGTSLAPAASEFALDPAMLNAYTNNTEDALLFQTL